MNRNHLDRIGRELTRDAVNPAPEEFYRGVWARIRRVQSEKARHPLASPFLELSRACWRSIPAFAALVVVLCILLWYVPFETAPETSSSAFDTLVMDSEEAPTNDSLLYQIVHTSAVSDQEDAR